MVHQVMLEKIQQKIAGFPRSVPLVPGNGLVQAEDAAALATSGETRLLHLEMIGESANATEKATTDKKPVIETGVGKQDPAWGGSDIVVFVRHKGMLLAANESVTQVRYPAEGSWYVPRHSSSYSSWLWPHDQPDNANSVSRLLCTEPLLKALTAAPTSALMVPKWGRLLCCMQGN